MWLKGPHLLREHHNEEPADGTQTSSTPTKGDGHRRDDTEGGISYWGQIVPGGPSLKTGWRTPAAFWGPITNKQTGNRRPALCLTYINCGWSRRLVFQPQTSHWTRPRLSDRPLRTHVQIGQRKSITWKHIYHFHFFLFSFLLLFMAFSHILCQTRSLFLSE